MQIARLNVFNLERNDTQHECIVWSWLDSVAELHLRVSQRLPVLATDMRALCICCVSVCAWHGIR